jgi:hypothetical protein
LGGTRAGDGEGAFREAHANVAGDALLTPFEEGFDVPHHGVEPQPLVEERAVEVAEGPLDGELATGEDELLDLAVRGDEDHRRRGLERDAALEPEDRVADVDPAADAVGPGAAVQLVARRRG